MKIIASVLLIILPFSTLLSNFSPYLSPHSFKDYLIACFIYALVLILLALYLSSKRIRENLKNGSLAWVALGVVIGPPLMLGPPEFTNLLQRVTEEHFRYGLLLISSILFLIGSSQILQRIKAKSYTWILLLAIVAISLWDNITSYNFHKVMETWIADGNQSSKFLFKYNFHEIVRTGGRTLIYVFVLVIGYQLYKSAQIKRWVWLTLSVFSLIGVVFYFLFNYVSVELYFPFMIPAVALAPVYWLGTNLLTNKVSDIQD